MNEDKKKKFKQTDIDLIATTIVKFLIVCCLPWVLISKLDRHLDQESEGSFDWWGFYWSFPATHLSWLLLTLVFGLPLWGLLGAPIVLSVYVGTGAVEMSTLAIILAVVIIAVIWVGLYYTARHYRSMREVRKVREKIYREESDLNEA